MAMLDTESRRKKNVTLADLVGMSLEVVEFPEKTLRSLYGTINLDDLTQVVAGPSYYDGSQKYVRCKLTKGGDHILPATLAVKRATKADFSKRREIFLDTQRATLSAVGWGGTIGTDPEVFVVDKKGNLIPAFLFLGSKARPSKAPPQSGASEAKGETPVYWDGFQAEFQTSVHHCLAWATDAIQLGLKGVYLHAIKYDKDARLTIQNLFEVDQKVIDDATEEQVAFGCSPSFNAYGMAPLIELDGRRTNLRCAGGHIHLGRTGLTKEPAREIVKTLDAVLAVCCVSMFEGIDDPRRRQMYGLAGEFRLPKHGLEYRVLSNAWLCHPYTTNLVFDLARTIASMGAHGLRALWDTDEDETVSIINGCDVKEARKVIERNKKTLDKILQARYGYPTTRQSAIKVIMEGVKEHMRDPDDLIRNWMLDDTWINHSNGHGRNCFNGGEIIGGGGKLP